MKWKLLLTFNLSLLFYNTLAYKGIVIMPSGTKSHMNYFEGIINALVSNGHQITFISTFTSSINSTSVKHVTVDDLRRSKIWNTFELNVFETIQMFLEFFPKQCINTFTNQDVQKALEEEYDYVVVSLYYLDCFLGWVYENKKPLIYVSQNELTNPYSRRIGTPEFSYSPHKMLPFVHPLSFRERVISTFMDFSTGFLLALLLDRRTERLCRDMNIWNPDIPSIYELQKQGSLAVINSVRSLEVPIKSTPRTIIYVGGIHIKEPKALPKDLEDWINDSGEDGFILFSLGTAVTPSDMTKEHLEIILNTFKTLKQKVLWKWNSDEMENKPPNVKLSSWVPQQDVLAHPKLKLFITHGGLFSILESTYFGVPIIGMPVFVDQRSNVANVVKAGWGLQASWTDLSENNFRDIVNEVLTNKGFREVVQKRSELMKDWPIDPKEEVVYWINYVVRHKGAKHLQSPLANMSWYEIYNMDAWLVILSTVFLLLFIIIYFLKLILKLCFKLCYSKKYKKE